MPRLTTSSTRELINEWSIQTNEKSCTEETCLCCASPLWRSIRLPNTPYVSERSVEDRVIPRPVLAITRAMK